MASVEKALQMLRNLPRVAIHNIKDLPEQIKMRKKQVEKKIKTITRNFRMRKRFLMHLF